MTAELKYKIKQVNSFIDEAFDPKHLPNFHLILQIGKDGMLCTVLDTIKNKYIAFEYYHFQQVENTDLIADLFSIAHSESKVINQRYKKVSCSVENNLSTLVPNALYEESLKTGYLKFNVGLEGNELILADTIQNLDAKNVFALPFSLKAKIDGAYSNVKYFHFSSGLIESLLTQNKNINTKRLVLHIQSTHFEALVIEGKKLVFYNTFNYHSPEDLIYYVLFVCEQLQLNPENIDTLIAGEVEKTSGVFAILQKYIRNVNFVSRIDNSDYSYQLQTFPKHFYYSLFNNFLV